MMHLSGVHHRPQNQRQSRPSRVHKLKRGETTESSPLVDKRTWKSPARLWRATLLPLHTIGSVAVRYSKISSSTVTSLYHPGSYFHGIYKHSICCIRVHYRCHHVKAMMASIFHCSFFSLMDRYRQTWHCNAYCNTLSLSLSLSVLKSPL